MRKTWLVIERENKQNFIKEVTQSDNILSITKKYKDIITITAFTTKKEAEKRIAFLYNLNRSFFI